MTDSTTYAPTQSDTPTVNLNTVPRRSGTARLIGLDVARGLAVLGMFAAHAGPREPGNWLIELVSGRSAALFAVLAGVSIALLSGGPRPETRGWGTASLRIGTRAVLLFPLGLALTSMQVPARVILAVYAMLFLLSIPLLRLRATAIGALAAITAIAGPLASFFIRQGMGAQKELGVTPKFADLATLEGLGRAFQALFLTGAYPVLTWIPFVLAGMLIGRLDLRSTAVRGWLAGIGAGLGLLGYGVSWLALNVFGGMDRIVALFGGALPRELIEAVIISSGSGAAATLDPIMLLTAAPHSGTPFEVVGATGCAMSVIGLCLLTSDRLRMLVTPLASVGALALTAYVAHLVALWFYGEPNLGQTLSAQPYLPWLVLMFITLIVTTLWRRTVGRGPLESVLHEASTRVGALAKR